MVQILIDNLGRMLLGLLVFAAACAAVALLWPAVAGGAAAAGAVTGAAIILTVIGAGVAGQSGGTPANSSTAVTEVDLGGVRVSGIPVDMVPQFLAEVQKQLQSIAGAAIATFKQSMRQA